MASITFPDLLITIFVLVDDWYQLHGIQFLAGKPGPKPDFSDSEVLTLMLAMDYLPFPSETQFIAYMRANYLSFFPKLVDQSQFNRRARTLRLFIEALRRHWLAQKGIFSQAHYLLDTKPVAVMGYKRSKKNSDFAGSADYGVGVSCKLKYFGYKLVTLTTLQGLPVVYDLVPANSDERLAAETVLTCLRGCHIFGDKGFLGANWQAKIYAETGNQIWTPKRANQFLQNPKSFDHWLNSIRERIEGAFHEIQNTGRNIERLLAKTILGCARV